MGENILEMKHITKSFFGVNVLKNTELTVKKGEVHILLGENGAGKSTLIKNPVRCLRKRGRKHCV